MEFDSLNAGQANARLEESLGRVVRRVLRSGSPSSPMAESILAIRRAILSTWTDRDSAGDGICRAIVQQLARQLQLARSGKITGETWAQARAFTAVY
jgi:hypothetical protein